MDNTTGISWLWAISRVQLVRGIGVSVPLETELDPLQISHVENEVRRSTVTQAMEVNPCPMCAGG